MLQCSQKSLLLATGAVTNVNNRLEQLEFLVEYYQTSIELTKQEIAKLANKK